MSPSILSCGAPGWHVGLGERERPIALRLLDGYDGIVDMALAAEARADLDAALSGEVA